jgi:carbamoyltransferase
MENYLGFNLGFNSSAVIYNSDKKVVSAISQERLNGQKNTKEIPFKAMIECCKIANVKEINGIAFSHYQSLTWEELLEKCPEEYYDICLQEAKENLFSPKQGLFELITFVLTFNGIDVKCNELVRVGHHKAHLNAGLAFYGIDNDYVGITMDGFGDGYSGSIRYVKQGQIENVTNYSLIDSIALIYQFVTGALGFKMHQHEGKITGLASYGKPLYLDMFKKTFCCDYANCWIVSEDKLLQLTGEEIIEAEKSPITDFDKFLRLRKTVFNFVEYLQQEYSATKQDIASTVQILTEQVIMKRIEIAYCEMRWDKQKAVCILSGGLFANVTLNKRINDSGYFAEVLVTPCMGDEGTALGSASSFVKNKSRKFKNEEDRQNEIVSNIFVGTKMENNLLLDCLSFNTIANYLKDNKIVCICHDKMEFGPRALCHRSILYNCKDKSINEWLNKRLNRTEFMPFAPVCLEEDANELFIDFDEKNCMTSRFMTITMDCTEVMKNNYPAAVHIDGTARPQIIGKEKENEFARNILQAYKCLTGDKVLINTSFNLHNNPIIECEKTAIKSWKIAGLDILIIDKEHLEKGCEI